MDNKSIESQINKELEGQDALKLLKVDAINFDPHPYTIGPRHIAHASDNHGGQLGTHTLNTIPCAVSKCGLMYDDHKYDIIAFFELLRNITSQECTDVLQKSLKGLDKEVDGVLFVETEAKYRVQDDN